MKRFMTGLLLGSASAGVAYGAGATPLLTAVIGVCVAVIVWFGQLILDDLL